MPSELTPEDLDEMIEDHEELLIVDVRAPAEYRERHIPGAINRPLASSADDDLGASRDRTVVLYSDRGARSAAAVTRLEAQGFERVYSLSGGLSSWQAAGMAVVQETS